MKILLVNKFNFLKGGADKYFLELAELLEQEGHEVSKFCMTHPDNLKDKYEKYFVSQVEFKGQLSFLTKLKAAGRLLFSFEARRKFKKLLDDFKPDLIHVHNLYHQISPSILPLAKKKNIPVVMHLHDYKLINPNYKMFDHGQINERSLGKNYYQCTLDRCFNDSFFDSLLVTLEMYLHHSWLKLYEKNIKYYLAPSEFMRNKVIAAGLASEKIIHLPYFVKNIENWQPNYEVGKYLLYFGRLTEEKGIDVLLRALVQSKDAPALKIVGAGEEEFALKKLAKDLKISKQVDFVGPLFGFDLENCIKQSLAVIVPSIWYEVFGLVNIEAEALGKMVIASNIGGIPESVIANKSAYLFTAGDVNDLSKAMEKCLANISLLPDYGKVGRDYVLNNFTSAHHLKKILLIYEKAIK